MHTVQPSTASSHRPVFEREVKFVVNGSDAVRLREWARQVLEPDHHGGGPHADEYATTTLYFDTPEFDVFRRQGSFGRSKLRIRRYGHHSSEYLYRKQRTDGVLAKRRTAVLLSDLSRLRGEMDSGWIGHWFHKRLAKRSLQPSCQVSYARMARVGQSHAGALRVTIDSDLRVLPTSDVSFMRSSGLLVLTDHAIVELKYQGEWPPEFRGLVAAFNLVAQGVSKYRLGIAALEPVLEPSARGWIAPRVNSGDAL
jgi:hypothetical protein